METSPQEAPKKNKSLMPNGYKGRGLQKPRSLTEKQVRFIQEYVKIGCLNASLAARQAGYSANTSSVAGPRMLALPAVQKAVQIARAKMEAAGQMTSKKVMDGFLEAIEMAKLRSDPLSMIAGWREIARMCGYYEPTRHKIEVSVNGQVVIDRLKVLPEHELLALAQGTTIDGEAELLSDI